MTAAATQDIDFVIAPTAAQLHALVAQLPPSEYYVDTDAALEALRHESLFNVVDLETGWKVDFICRKSRPFSRAEFERRTRVELLGVALHIATAEDLLLAKLEWANWGDPCGRSRMPPGSCRCQATRLTSPTSSGG